MTDLTRDAAANQGLRYFIITVGRSGSSLLCALLADAGADFGLPIPTDWEADAGVLEHPGIVAAAHQYRRAYDAQHGRFWFSPEIESRWRRGRARLLLRKALAVARYVKIGDLDLCVQPAAKLGYSPRVILSYRRFLPSATSILVGRTHDGGEAVARDYLRSYRQGLMLLRVFGGCAIAYEDLIGAAAPDCLMTLARVTGLDPQRLRAAHAHRIRAGSAPEPESGPYREAEEIYAQLQELRGVALEPSARARRSAARRATEL